MTRVFTETQISAVEAIAEVVQRHEVAIGPHWSGQGDPPAREGMILTSWVLMASWTDPEDGHTWQTLLTPENQPNFHNKGLIWEALHWEMID